MTQAADNLLTVEAAAERLGIGRSTMYAMIGRREIRSLKVGRKRKIRPEVLAEYITAREAATQCDDG